MASNSILIPDNKVGKSVDLEYTIEAIDTNEADVLFNTSCTKLLDPSSWHTAAGAASASFKIYTTDGSKIDRPVQKGDYLMIDIPGPGPSAGEGYDWVKVETVEQNILQEADKSMAIKLKTCANPGKEEEGVAHFFEAGATSTFILKRIGKTITISYHGRNEIPNITNVGLSDKIRNSFVAIGASVGLSELQWNSLLKGILKEVTE